MKPPLAPRRTDVRRLHGIERDDPYSWLRDEDWRRVMEDPSRLRADIRRHLDAENAYSEAALAHLGGLRDRLFAEIRGRIKEDDSSVPVADGPFEYFSRYRVGGQHPIVCRQVRGTTQAEVLLDGDEEAAGLAFYSLGDWNPSPDHRFFAWTCDRTGAEAYTLHVKEIDGGRLVGRAIDRCQGDVEWAADGRTLLYTALDEHHRPWQVRRHDIHLHDDHDPVVYEERDPGFFVVVSRTESRRFVVIDAHDHETSEAWLVDSARPGEPPRLVAARSPGVEYDVGHQGNRLVIRTNAGGAEDFKLVEAPLDGGGADRWMDLVPHRPGVLILGCILTDRFVVRLERVDGLPRIVVREARTGLERELPQDEEIYSLALVHGHEYAEPCVRYVYSSMTTPERTYDVNLDTGARSLRKAQAIPSGHDPAAYVSRRIMVPGHDGERVPVSVLHRRDTVLDGSSPLVLYGYGAYGHAIPAAFEPTTLSLVDRGCVYAIAHVRGGTDCGYRWYTAGKREAKRNSFLDFIRVAEHLADEHLVSRHRIVAHGRSAGGLLVGAAVTMRPDLFAGVAAEVPFVDVLTTMCDATLPLTPPEWPEWGNPIEDEEAYRRLAAYSPYDNVSGRRPPRMLVTAGLADPRVTYWEPAKWVAKIRFATGGAADVLLRTNMEAGHGGASGRLGRLKETALVYAFVLDVLGLARVNGPTGGPGA